jgi:ABC-2 type transport system ATP-binding protein
MRKGQLIACDTPDSIRGMIMTSELIYIAVEQISPEQTQKLENLPSVNKVSENSDYLVGNQKGFCLQLKAIDQVPAIFDFLYKENIKLVDFHREEPTLEDAFIELTGRA